MDPATNFIVSVLSVDADVSLIHSFATNDGFLMIFSKPRADYQLNHQQILGFIKESFGFSWKRWNKKEHVKEPKNGWKLQPKSLHLS